MGDCGPRKEEREGGRERGRWLLCDSNGNGGVGLCWLLKPGQVLPGSDVWPWEYGIWIALLILRPAGACQILGEDETRV